MEKKPTLILLVEDEPLYAKLIQDIVNDYKEASFKLFHAESLKEGIDYIAKEDIEIVLLDLMLPDSIGLDTFSNLRKNAKDIPIVIISSLDDEEIAIDALKMGAEDYLFKVEVKPNNLVRTLRYAVERKRAHEEIRRSEEKLRTLFSGFPLPSFTWQYSGDDFILVDYNKAALEVTGKKISDFIDIKFSELYSDKPEIVDDIMRCYTKSVIIRKDYEYCYQITEKVRFLAVTMVPIPPESVFVFTEDITERKAAEAEQKRSRDELEINVKERTTELSETNEKLKQEIEERKQAEEALSKSQQEYQSLFEDSPISLWVEDFSEVKKYIDALRNSGVKDFREYFRNNKKDLEKCASLVRVVDINKATLEMYNAESKDVFLKGLGLVFNKEFYDAFKEEIAIIAAGKTFYESEAVNRTLTGEKKHISFKWTVAPGSEETYSKVFVSITDITDRKKAEESLRIRDWAMHSSISAIIIVALDGTITYANPSFIKMSGYDNISEITGMSLMEFWQEEHKINEILDYLRSTESWVGELVIKRKDNSVVDVQLSVSLVKNEEGKPISIMGSLVDITKRKKLEEDLWILSITDSLTGLHNQRHFYKKIEEEIVRAKRMTYPMCLMILDLDNFKQYNDRYGHQKGDDVLRKIGGIINKTIRRQIDSAFRYGGDEFAVLLPNAEKEIAFQVAKRIENKVKKRFKDESIGISFGIELLIDNLTIEDFIRAADVAMYKDKRLKKTRRANG